MVGCVDQSRSHMFLCFPLSCFPFLCLFILIVFFFVASALQVVTIPVSILIIGLCLFSLEKHSQSSAQSCVIPVPHHACKACLEKRNDIISPFPPLVASLPPFLLLCPHKTRVTERMYVCVCAVCVCVCALCFAMFMSLATGQSSE